MKSNREWNFHQFWNSDGDEKILNNSNEPSVPSYCIGIRNL